MFAFTKATLFKDALNIAFVLLLIVIAERVVINWGSIRETLLGTSKQTLVVQNAQLQENFKVAQATLKENKETTLIQVENLRTNQTAVTALVDHHTTSLQKTQVLQQKAKAEVQVIRADPTLTPSDRDQAEASVQIDMLWSNYCTLQPTSCKGI